MPLLELSRSQPSQEELAPWNSVTMLQMGAQRFLEPSDDMGKIRSDSKEPMTRGCRILLPCW